MIKPEINTLNVAFDIDIEIKLKLLSQNATPISNFYTTIDFNPLKIPSYFYGSWKNWGLDYFKQYFFKFNQTANMTDANGEIIVKINIQSNYVGIYVINFIAGGGVSHPLTFITPSPISKILIINENFINFTLTNPKNTTEMQSKYLRNGNFLPPVRF